MGALLETIVRKVLKVVVKDSNDRLTETAVQFIKFGIVGVSNTVISYLINIMVLFLLQPYQLIWDYVAGNIIAFILSVLWSFYWNNRMVFAVGEGEHGSIWRTLVKTYIAYGFTSILLNNILSWMWVSVIGISKFIAPLINLIISVPLNFIMNKLWTFKGDKSGGCGFSSISPHFILSKKFCSISTVLLAVSQ